MTQDKERIPQHLMRVKAKEAARIMRRPRGEIGSLPFSLPINHRIFLFFFHSPFPPSTNFTSQHPLSTADFMVPIKSKYLLNNQSVEPPRGGVAEQEKKKTWRWLLMVIILPEPKPNDLCPFHRESERSLYCSIGDREESRRGGGEGGGRGGRLRGR